MEKDPFLEIFATRLAALREQRNKSAREMSLDLGQTHSFINAIETQRYLPTMLNFVEICRYLGVTEKEFLDYDNENPKMTGELYQEIIKLDRKSQEYFLNLIRDVNNRPKPGSK